MWRGAAQLVVARCFEYAGNLAVLHGSRVARHVASIETCE
jgi:hypothetical protein